MMHKSKILSQKTILSKHFEIAWLSLKKIPSSLRCYVSQKKYDSIIKEGDQCQTLTYTQRRGQKERHRQTERDRETQRDTENMDREKRDR